MSFFNNAETVTLAGKVVTKLELAGETIYEKIVQKFKNWVPISIDTDGSIFNGVGYQDGYRLSSSGAAKALTGSTVTGFIEATAGDVIRIKRIPWNDTAVSTNYVCCYDENFNHLGAFTSVKSLYGIFQSSGNTFTITDVNGVTEIVFTTTSTVKYIRISCGYSSNPAYGVNAIVTVNEEITE